MRNVYNIYDEELKLQARRPLCEGKGNVILYLKQVLSGRLVSSGST
jgi:hypothetical protein